MACKDLVQCFQAFQTFDELTDKLQDLASIHDPTPVEPTHRMDNEDWVDVT